MKLLWKIIFSIVLYVFYSVTLQAQTKTISGDAPDDSGNVKPEAFEAAGSRPNIVFILSDDMGWAQPGFNGGNKELTPNMDKLATEGLMLTQFYTHSVCSPTRGALLTGRYSFRNWMDWRSEDFGKDGYLKTLGLTIPRAKNGEPTRRIHALDTKERTIAEALKEAGYFTAIIGKWHCGEWLPENLPMAQGFMYQYGHYGWGVDYYSKCNTHNVPRNFAVYDWHRNQQPLQEEGYSTDLIADETERVISQQTKDKPFFLYVPFNAIHGPNNKPPRYADEYGVEGAMVKCLDDGVGKIVDAINKYGLRDNTLIVFTNDNGGQREEQNKPYRGTKNTTFEGGVRQPCLVSWPGHIEPGKTNNDMMFVADWYSTLITLGGGNHDQKLRVDAIDMTDMLFNGRSGKRTEIIFDVTGSVRIPTIRSGDYKLMGSKLYNIVTDPSERTDIASNHPKLVTKLKARLKEVGKERPPLGDKTLLMDPPLPYTYGIEENKNPPEWLIKNVEEYRNTQTKTWILHVDPPKIPVENH